MCAAVRSLISQAQKPLTVQRLSAYIWMVAGICLIIVFSTGCTNPPVQEEVVRKTVAYDGNHHDAGLVSISKDGATLRKSALDKYNALIEGYGKNFLPPLKPGDGVVSVDDLYLMDLAHWDKFVLMNGWHNQNRPSATPTPSVMKKIVDAVIK